jgi:hypothetical protein
MIEFMMTLAPLVFSVHWLICLLSTLSKETPLKLACNFKKLSMLGRKLFLI